MRLAMKDAGVAREMRAFALEIRAAGEDGIIEGYGSVFNVEDSYSDTITPGAFAASIAAHQAAGTMPAMLWQHDAEHPVGVWTDMAEDARGLRVKGRLAMETQRGREAYALLKMGAITGLSIGFVTRQWTHDEKTGVRIVTEIDLWEVSLVTFPANARARVTSVKAADAARINTIRQAEKALRDAGFSDDAAKAFMASAKRIVIDERDARDTSARFELAASRLLKTLQS